MYIKCSVQNQPVGAHLRYRCKRKLPSPQPRKFTTRQEHLALKNGKLHLQLSQCKPAKAFSQERSQTQRNLLTSHFQHPFPDFFCHCACKAFFPVHRMGVQGLESTHKSNWRPGSCGERKRKSFTLLLQLSLNVQRGRLNMPIFRFFGSTHHFQISSAKMTDDLKRLFLQ